MHLSELCRSLHQQLEALPIIRFPFDLTSLPNNGIYFFYEDGEYWGHGGERPRVVRIGTHRKDGNFRHRIGEHFALDERRMNFDATRAAPRERSIFRKHIGRALLKQRGDPYLAVWEIDFTSREKREKYGHLRDIAKEKVVESEITARLRESFSFRFIIVDGKGTRRGLEQQIIGTVAQCSQCCESKNWLGTDSPKPEIRESGLWQIQHLKASALSPAETDFLSNAVGSTCAWIHKAEPRR